MKITSTDYHDYVFKDHQLVGEFEQMYINSAEVPWHQDTVNSKWFVDIAYSTAARAVEDADVARIHEVGCGLGYFLNKFNAPGRELIGTDVSPTAIEKARQLHPHLTFDVGDIRSGVDVLPADLVLTSNIIWYLIPEIEAVFENLAALVKHDKYLFVHLSFPKEEEDFFGKEVFPNRQPESPTRRAIQHHSRMPLHQYGNRWGPRFLLAGQEALNSDISILNSNESNWRPDVQSYPQFKNWPQTRPLVVAEVGFNHGGNEELAWEMIQAAAEAGADFVKLQTFRAKDFFHSSLPYFSTTQSMELSFDAFERLFKQAGEAGIKLFSTPFDEASADFLEQFSIWQNAAGGSRK